MYYKTKYKYFFYFIHKKFFSLSSFIRVSEPNRIEKKLPIILRIITFVSILAIFTRALLCNNNNT